MPRIREIFNSTSALRVYLHGEELLSFALGPAAGARKFAVVPKEGATSGWSLGTTRNCDSS